MYKKVREIWIMLFWYVQVASHTDTLIAIIRINIHQNKTVQKHNMQVSLSNTHYHIHM